MSTSNSLIDRANRLRNDIDNVMTQIHSAENGNRLERNHFLSLLTRKNAIVAEANGIINEINQTLNLATSNPDARVPHHIYLDLKNARTIAREVRKIAYSAPTGNSSSYQISPACVARPSSGSDWLDDLDDDIVLPF